MAATVSCGHCGRSRTGTRVRCACIPEHVWGIPEARNAVRDRDVGALLAVLRRHTTLSQTALAQMAGMTQSTVSKLLSGQSQYQRRDRIEAALYGLGAGPRRTTSAAVPDPTSPTDVLQRQISESSESDAVRLLRNFDRETPDVDLYGLIRNYLSSHVGPRLLSESAGPQTFCGAAGLTEMAGWMAHDSGHDDLAGQHFRRARALARAADSAHLFAQSMASDAHLALHQGDASAASCFAEHAWNNLNGTEDAALRARVLAMLMRSHAGRADASAFRSTLARAEHLLSAATGPSSSPWTSPFDVGTLAAEAARGLCDLGEYRAAGDYAREVLRIRPANRPRSRALASLTLARALLGQGLVEEAAVVAGEVAGSRAHGSAVARSTLQALKRHFYHHRRVPEVARILRETSDRQATIDSFNCGARAK